STLFHPVGGTLTGDIRVGTPVDAQRFRLQVDIHQHIFDLRMGLETVGGGFKLLETGGRQAQLTTAQQVDATNDFTTLGSSGCGGNRIQVSTFGNEDQQQVVGNLGTAVGLLQLIGSWRNDGDRVADGKAHAIALAAAQTQKHCLVTGQTGRHHKPHPLFGDDLRQDDLVTQHHPQIVMVVTTAFDLEVDGDIRTCGCGCGADRGTAEHNTLCATSAGAATITTAAG